MKRSIFSRLNLDLNKKSVILSGPRQCGKTFIAKSLNANSYQYLNFDVVKDRKILIKNEWNLSKKIIIFDEIHKMKKWKSWFKGIVDSEQLGRPYLVTGSARLNTYKKIGDSLAGRYFYHRFFPFDLKEISDLFLQNEDMTEINFLFDKNKLNQEQKNKIILNRLMNVSGFPEPFLNNEKGFYNRWSQTHLEVILKQDILETENVKSIKQIEILTSLLTEKVGNPLSYNSLTEDLQTDDKSIKRWVDILENAYVIFRIYPYTSKSFIHGLKKSPKLFFIDYCKVEDESNRFENLVAMSLFKEICIRMDSFGEKFELRYIQNKQKKEIDFLILKNNKPHIFIEAKLSETSPSENFKLFEKYFPKIRKVQVVKNAEEFYLHYSGVEVWPAHVWLAKLDF